MSRFTPLSGGSKKKLQITVLDARPMSQSGFMDNHQHQRQNQNQYEMPPPPMFSKMTSSLSVDNLLGDPDLLDAAAAAQPRVPPQGPPAGAKRPTIIRPSRSNDNLKSATLQGTRPPPFTTFDPFEMPQPNRNDPGALVNPSFRLESEKNRPPPPRPRKKMPPPRPPPLVVQPKSRDKPQTERSSSMLDGELISFDPLVSSTALSRKDFNASTANSRSVMSELEEIFAHTGPAHPTAPLMPERVGAAADAPPEVPPAKPARKPTSMVKPILTAPHAKARYDFEKEQPDDLAMKVGDVIRLIERKSSQWLLGFNFRTRQEGIFPESYVEVVVPLSEEKPATLAPTPRARGAVQKSGSLESQPPWLAPAKPTEGPSRNSGHFSWPPKPEPVGPKPVANGPRPPILSAKPKLPKSPKPRAPICRALFPYMSGVEGDLNFEAGEMVHLLGRESEAWLKGELRGRIGIFPTNYVEIIEDLPTPSPPLEAAPALPPKTERPPPPTMKAPPPPVSPTPPKAPPENKALFFVEALYDYSGPSGDLSFSTGDTIKVTKLMNEDWMHGELAGVEGAFPANFVKRQEAPKQPLAKATFSFESAEAGDLTFQVGDEILLKEEVDADWLRGELKGRVGIFPKSFVEIIVPLT